ncbi:MAG: N-6 DNA methylase [Candidatus Firestonebacteria bacterium]
MKKRISHSKIITKEQKLLKGKFLSRLMKREETNDIVQNLYDLLKDVGIDKKFCKQDVTTQHTLTKRGDVWISLFGNSNKKEFEKNIIALIEAKHKKCIIGDRDWKDAMKHGEVKSLKQKLNYYIVTNCKDSFRFYNSHNNKEIKLDGEPITRLQPIKVLIKIQTQVDENNSDVVNKIKNEKMKTERDFQKSLYKLKNIFRSGAIKKSDEKINTTVSFIILKYISEMELEEGHLDKVVKLWDEYGTNFKADIEGSIKDILSGEYGKKYVDFKGMINFSKKLKNNHYAKIHSELDKYHFHGCGFDVYGAIYEEFASKKEKKEFGEFYTRRHITNVISKLLLKDEKIPRDIKICDPACGTGGFLTESFKTLIENYSENKKLDSQVLKKLKTDVFYGYDNQVDSIQRTILNMFLVGDGHTNIKEKDSLVELEEETFDYIIANPPYGLYEGDVSIDDFEFTNQRRFELLFLEKIIKATKYGGEMAIVVPDGALETPTNEGFRKKLLQNCTIKGILSLTRFAFAPYTKEKTYVLFMQRKQKEDVGKIQTEPIWHFILDYDGYANSDKRFLTPKHNDISLLEKTFLEGEEKGKYGFVDMKNVNTNNFHNLLSEFYLRPIKIEKKTILEFNDNFDELNAKLKKLIKKSSEIGEEIKNNHTIKKVDIIERGALLNKIDKKGKVIGGVLKLLPKNQGLTEEFIYLNEDPTKEQIPIYTSSYKILGYLPKGTLKDGDPLKINKGESIIVFRKGKAGSMFFVDDDKYIACENAIPFQISDEYKGIEDENKIVLLKWFYYTYRKIFLNMVTSKADNATFNLDFLKRLKIDIPKKEIQERIIQKYEMLESLEQDIKEVFSKLKDMEFTSIKEG